MTSVSEGLRFGFEGEARWDAGRLEARVYDPAGASVAVLPVARNAGRGLQAVLPRGTLAAGAYVLRMRSGESTVSRRFVRP